MVPSPMLIASDLSDSIECSNSVYSMYVHNNASIRLERTHFLF